MKSPPSLETRPTSDRLRETLFNVLAPNIKGASFLDLCAGSGAVGIEALSRGAVHSTFVDRSRQMCALIEANVAALSIEAGEVAVVVSETCEFLRKRAKREGHAFDVVYYDPPYDDDYEAAMSALGESADSLLKSDGLVVVEHHKKKDLAERFGGLQRHRILKQGDSCLSFYELVREQ